MLTQMNVLEYLQGVREFFPEMDDQRLSRLFLDYDYYYAERGDVESEGVDAFYHYFTFGRYEKIGWPKPGNIFGNVGKTLDDDTVLFLVDDSTDEKIVERFQCADDSKVDTLNLGHLNDKNFIERLSDVLNKKLVINLCRVTAIGEYFYKICTSLGKSYIELAPEIHQFLMDAADNSGLKIEAITKLLLDSGEYIKDNPDLLRKKLIPINHFLLHGIREGRPEPKCGDVYTENAPGDGVLYFSNAIDRDGSFKYRCFFPSKAIDNTYCLNKSSDPLEVISTLFKVKKVIFSRPENVRLNKYFMELCKRLSIEVVFDYDDLLLPDFAHELGHVRSMGSNYADAYRGGLLKCQYMHLADRFTCSTPLLMEKLASYNKPVELKRNKLPVTYFNENEIVDEGKKLNIIYLSGTATHKRDFMLINGVLIKLAQLYPERFRLTFLGNVQANLSIFRLLGVECEQIPRVDFMGMLEVISKHDLALVPLENTVFNNAKSNIKFIECASQGVPVVASAVSEFENFIEDGISGWLASNDLEWFSKLEKILKMPKTTIKKLGIEAQKLAKAELSSEYIEC